MTLVLVTGGTGFIGRAVCAELRRRAIPFRVLSREAVADSQYVVGDICDPPSLGDAVRGVTHVIHCAGIAHVFMRSDAPYLEINRTGVLNVAAAAVREGVRRLVVVSSVAVYGGGVGADESGPCAPSTPYGESKLLGEQAAAAMIDGTETSLVILRMATVYGPGDPGNVKRLTRALIRGRFLWIGDGTNRKSLIYVSDAARACVEAVVAPEASGVYNVSAEPVMMRDIVNAIASAAAARILPWRIPASIALLLIAVLSRLPKGRTLARTIATWLADDVYEARRFNDTVAFWRYTPLQDGIRAEVAWYQSIP